MDAQDKEALWCILERNDRKAVVEMIDKIIAEQDKECEEAWASLLKKGGRN